jgi:7-cyano-7-deazaguanine synthase
MGTRQAANLSGERPPGWASGASLAVLTSGGLDSSILLAEALRSAVHVYPLYVRHGLAWEEAELTHLHRFLEQVSCPVLRPLHILDLPVRDLYGDHWSLSGQNVPDADSPDEAVYLPGRNVLLLSKSMVWCHLNGIRALALAPLASNPFADATPAFFNAFRNVVNQAVKGHVDVLRPYARLSKREVMQRGAGLPLSWTFSCIRPVGGRHCGQCNKCGERRQAFRDAGTTDETEYDAEEPCTA